MCSLWLLWKGSQITFKRLLCLSWAPSWTLVSVPEKKLSKEKKVQLKNMYKFSNLSYNSSSEQST